MGCSWFNTEKNKKKTSINNTNMHQILTSCFGLMTDSAVVDSALRKSGLISNGKE